MHDLEEAISSSRHAVEITPAGDPDLSTHLSNFGRWLKAHFDHTGNIHDLEEAIARNLHAINITPTGHPHLPLFLTSLGDVYLRQGPQGFPFALNAFRDAALTIPAASSIRLRAARQWARVCHFITPADFEIPYQMSMSLLTDLIG